MDSLDKVIGYEEIKLELRKIVDMIQNTEKYEALGANLPHGIMFYGSPGVGKTLMANCLVELSGLPCYVCRKNKPNGEFVNHIRETFSKAMKNEPAIILLDDLDKFSSDGSANNNSEEYITVQSCIDSVKERKVIVVATVNSKYSLPESLLREGRFDEKFEIKKPRGEDAKQIIKYYLSQKKHVADLDINEVAKLLDGFSCAELESLINKAGVSAAFENKKKIEMDDILKAYIKNCYKAPLCSHTRTEKLLNYIAYHESAHVVASELLEPGSTTLVTIVNNSGNISGFTAYYENDDSLIDSTHMENKVLALLAGKAIMELKFGKVDIGTTSDISRAYSLVEKLISNYCQYGFKNYYSGKNNMPEQFHLEINKELDKYYLKCKELLAPHIDMVNTVAQALMEKELLSHTEIANLMKGN